MVSSYLQNIKKQGSSTRMTQQIFMHYKEKINMDQEKQEALSKAKGQNLGRKLTPKFVCNIHKIILGLNVLTCKTRKMVRGYIITELIKNKI